MILQAIVGVLVLTLAVVVPFVPQQLYEENYLEKTQHILSLDYSSELFEKPTTVAVTGANSGLGFASVQHLVHRCIAKKNSAAKMTIVMACRSMERCDKAKNDILQQYNQPDAALVELVTLQLDLASKESIQKFSVELQNKTPRPPSPPTEKEDPEEEGEENNNDEDTTDTTSDSTTTSNFAVPPLHVMINNAGVAAPYPQLEYHPAYGIETQFHVNYIGHVLLTHYVWSNIMAVNQQDPTRKARLVTVSEGGARFPVDPMKGWYAQENTPHTGILAPILNMVTNMKQYARSKQGQLFFAAELQALYPDSLTTSAAQPGYTRTPIYVSGFHGFPTFLKYIVGYNPLGSMSPEQGAETILLSTLDQTAQYVGPKWFFFGPPVAVGRGDNLNAGSVHHRPFSRQRTMALWDRTIKVLGIAEFGKKDYVTM
ncbi:Dehydrogenase/reductase SDR family member 13 [Seminavis robusta]|uniref:Dehydrogenase/reductase SDR family member 13 n=1 Tax=Seminavis robusta TaxID=568900 RepID=A0A9N8E6U4_9STRA|nr:Dehydrogenase/reductase SDR family member 13 [Seminavis robusta]|eukprot:Sro684_g186820.1 Dehydrogenase/reductase SDR family member 13 (428) ;mRNA; f:40315-41598